MEKRRLSGGKGFVVVVGTMLLIIAVLWAIAIWGSSLG